jgi:hypothetical protein
LPKPQKGCGCSPASERPPTRGLDYDYLARWDLSGGNIMTASLNAAFRAAARGADAVEMQDVLPAIEEELRKLNRPVRPAELYPRSLRPAAPPAPAPVEQLTGN